jgi:hypothetical protein
MKTAMQELIEAVNEHIYNPLKKKESFNTIKYLEKEKEQICNAYTDGLEGPYIGSEEYYNQTYNQNK